MKYNVIDTHTGDLIIQMSAASIVSSTIGIPNAKVSNYAKRNVRWQGRYRIIPFDDNGVQAQTAYSRTETEWAKEWDRVRHNPYIWHTIDDTLIGSFAPIKPNPYIRGKRTVAREKIVIEFTPRKGVG